VAREKLIPERPDTETEKPKDRFRELASKIFAVPKVEIDKREKEWAKQNKQKKTIT
jgi:hypothetical protein